MTFKAIVDKFSEGIWSYHILVPDKVYKKLSKNGNKRVVCQLDDHKKFHGGFMPEGNGNFFIMLSKDKMKKFKLTLGQDVKVSLEVDTSKYGMEMPKEFEEVLNSDFEGEQYYEALTPGKKRSLIYLVSNVKSVDIKIIKALTILDHLKINQGKLDYKSLNEAFKVKNRKY